MVRRPRRQHRGPWEDSGRIVTVESMTGWTRLAAWFLAISYGIGAPTALRNFDPPASPAGKNFCKVYPRSSNASISDAVTAPGTNGTRASAAAPSNASVEPGLTMKRAPALTTSSTWPGHRMLPAPTSMSGTSLAMRSIAATPCSVRNVTSMAPRPDSSNVRASGTAVSASSITTTGTTLKSRNRLAAFTSSSR